MIIGWENLAKYLGVCKSVVETIAKVRGLGTGRRIIVDGIHGGPRRVWTLQEIHEWQKKSKWDSHGTRIRRSATYSNQRSRAWFNSVEEQQWRTERRDGTCSKVWAWQRLKRKQLGNQNLGPNRHHLENNNP